MRGASAEIKFQSKTDGGTVAGDEIPVWLQRALEDVSL
jgi:hypothetical protein